MKKLIQFCSMLSLVVVLAAGAATAATPVGTDYGSQVQIPFSFNVAEKTFEAGTYIINVNKVSSGAATLVIRNVKTGESQALVMTSRGDGPADDLKLVFENVGDKKVLTKVKTSSETFALLNPRVDKRSTGAAAIGSGASLF